MSIPRPLRGTSCPSVRLAAAALMTLVASAAGAGPVSPDHRLETLGTTVSGGVELLHVPGTNRALVLEAGGRVREITAGSLVDVVIATIPTETSCAEHGVLEAIWDPAAPGEVVYVTYTHATTRALSAGRLDLATRAFAQVWTHGVAAAACTNVGGGLAFGPDGALYVGIGDMGQPDRAASGSSNVGKIYRMTTDGRPPTAPANPIPGSFVYGMGLRNPVALTLDPAGAGVWILDQGPGDEDELNLLVPLGNYGWSAALQMGPQGDPALEDPYSTWGPGQAPSSLEPYAGTILGSALDGSLIVSTEGTATISAVRPDLSDRLASTRTDLFLRGAGDPAFFADLRVLPDGQIYLVDDVGAVRRLATRRGAPREPSARDSVVPLSVRKASGGLLEISVERVNGATEYGVFESDVTTLAQSGYTHLASPARYEPVDASPTDAFTRMTIPSDEIGDAAYLLVSARRDCAESGLGEGTHDVRPTTAPVDCGLAVLGGGSNDVADVVVTVIADNRTGLNLPRDLAFHPDAPNELWVVNRRDHSATIIRDAGLPTQWSTWHTGDASNHFFAQPSALAFGPGTPFLATSHEEDDFTQGPPPLGTPQDFMGPTMWISDSTVFNGDHMSHYDMLHNTPNGMGIAWETDTVYWVYDGAHLSLTRYDFNDDHGPGGDYYSDAVITRYAEGEVGYQPDVVSHVQYEQATGFVYAADTANGRIVAMDPSTARDAGPIGPNYDGCVQRNSTGARVWTLVEGSDHGLVAPSGLEIHDGMIFVTDNATSRIFAFDMSGALVDYLETGFPSGTLMGMAFHPTDDSIYLVDTVDERILRISPR